MKVLCFLSVLISVFLQGCAPIPQDLVPATATTPAKLLSLAVENGDGRLLTLEAEFVVQADPALNSFNGVFGEGLPPSLEGLPLFNDDLVGTRNAATAILERLSESDINPSAFFGFPAELAKAPYLLGGFEGGGGDLGKLFFPLNVSAERFDLLETFSSFDNDTFGSGEILVGDDATTDIMDVHREDSWCNTCQPFFVGEGVEIWVILREVDSNR